jgi:hypothetical protein
MADQVRKLWSTIAFTDDRGIYFPGATWVTSTVTPWLKSKVDSGSLHLDRELDTETLPSFQAPIVTGPHPALGVSTPPAFVPIRTDLDVSIIATEPVFETPEMLDTSTEKDGEATGTEMVGVEVKLGETGFLEVAEDGIRTVAETIVVDESAAMEQAPPVIEPEGAPKTVQVPNPKAKKR